MADIEVTEQKEIFPLSNCMLHQNTLSDIRGMIRSLEIIDHGQGIATALEYPNLLTTRRVPYELLEHPESSRSV